jgi:hypothetical protein
MRRSTFYLMVALLAFAVGTATVSLWFMVRHSSSVTIKPVENISPDAAPAQPKREYEMELTGRGMPRDGVSIAFSGWKTSDGMSFSITSEYHTSPERAYREFQEVIKKAARIIKREPLFDWNSRQVGEKVIATFPSVYSRYGTATLLLTYGSTFRYVSSSSLENILVYEIDFNGQLP